MQLVGDELVILRRDCVEGIVACEVAAAPKPKAP